MGSRAGRFAAASEMQKGTVPCILHGRYTTLWDYNAVPAELSAKGDLNSMI